MIIKCCKECPFFQESPLSAGFMGILIPSQNWGTCGYNPDDDSLVWEFGLGMTPSPEKDAAQKRARSRLAVLDKHTIPSGCPLRTRKITLELAGN